MAELTSDTIFDILSRVPAESLARFRCVSKPWCGYIDNHYFGILHGERVVEELAPIMYDPNLSCIIRFDIIRSEFQERETNLVAKKGISFESELYKSCSTYRRYSVGGSCNGLLYLSIYHNSCIISLAVIHPLRKEFYRLPTMQQWLDGPYYLSEESRGLGFDVSTNTFKMVCVLSRREYTKSRTLDSICKNLCTMIHVLGVDNSWREIPQVPPYPTSGDGIFAHGYLYWLVSYEDSRQSSSREKFICFNVSNEEFTLIDPPKRRCDCSVAYHHLVDLRGEVGYACFYSDDIIEVWVLKEKQWLKHCQFSKKPPLPRGHIEVLGRWNMYGDLLIKSSDRSNKLFVYSLKSRVFNEVDIVGQEYGRKAYMYMYPASSIFSIRGINKTAHLIKTDLNAG